MSEDPFFERLRHDAAPLRYEPDAVAIARVAARIRARTTEGPAAVPTVAQILARWFRPLAAAVTAIAIAAGIGLATLDSGESNLFSTELEITMAGDTYRVGE